MKQFKYLPLLMLIALLAAALAACLPRAQFALPQSPAATLDKVRTQAVATALAALTMAAYQPSTITETPTPEPTATSLPPSSTPIPTAAPTRVVTTPAVVYNAPTYTATPAQTDYLCSVEEIEPEAGKTVRVGADFDFVVRLKNTGVKGWLPGKILFVYTSGQKMQAKASMVLLTSKVSVDDEVNFTLDMVAPDAPGTYQTTWALQQPPLFFCPVHFKIVVTR